VMLIIFAGHETTATSFLAALFALKRKPEVQAKLREAVDTCRDENGKLDMEKIHQLDYLKAFVWEVLRMYPPVTQSPRNYNGKIRKYDVEKKVFVESEETIS